MEQVPCLSSISGGGGRAAFQKSFKGWLRGLEKMSQSGTRAKLGRCCRHRNAATGRKTTKAGESSVQVCVSRAF